MVFCVGKFGGGVGEPRKGVYLGGGGVKRREMVTYREDSKLERHLHIQKVLP